MRLFVAVDPGERVLSEVGRAIERLRPLAQDAKWVRVEGSHLTLVFLGEVPEERLEDVKGALERGARGHARFELVWEGGGCFGGRKPRVLWVGTGGDTEALLGLQQSIQRELRALGFGEEEHSFHPHLTLARAREARGDLRLSACAEKLAGKCLGTTEIAEVVLYKSELGPRGSTYVPLLRVGLSPTPGATFPTR